MHVLFLDQFSLSAQPGGAQQCLRDLLPAVTAQGWQYTVADNLPLGPFHHGHKSFQDALLYARQIPAIRRAIRNLPGDLIYVNGPRLLPGVPSGRPVVFHCHNYLGQSYAAWLARRAISRTQATVIGACRFVLQPLRQPAAQVVYNGVKESPPQVPGDKFRIGMIGRIAKQKGQAEFLQAARHLEGCQITICGAPLFGEASYEAKIRAQGAQLKVAFQGWTEDPGQVLRQLDLLVVPSTVPEAAPRVILEAFSAGVPVLASAQGGIPELIEHNRTGFLIDNLQAQLSHLASQPDLRAQVAANARDEWSARFTLEEYQSRILRIVETAGARAHK